MSVYNIASAICVILVLLSFWGLFYPLPIFMNKRSVAVGVLLLMIIALPATDGLKNDKDRANDAESAQINQRVDEHEDVKGNLQLTTKLDPVRGTISGKIVNSSEYDYKNVRAKCVLTGASGKKIEAEKIEILKVVRGGMTVDFTDIHFGYVDSQAAGFNCELTGADKSY